MQVSRRAHQVTVCAMFQCLQDAYQEYVISLDEAGMEAKSLEDWCNQQRSSIPIFKFFVHCIGTTAHSTDICAFHSDWQFSTLCTVTHQACSLVFLSGPLPLFPLGNYSSS